MSYSHAYNQNLFSSLQIDRIHKKISADNGLKQASTFTRRVIDGPTFISTQGTYNISVPNNYSVSWNVKCDTYSSYSGGVSSTTNHEYTGKSITLTNLNDSKSKKYTLIASFTTPKGIVRTIEKTVFYISLSPQNGNWRWSAELGTNSVKAGEISMTSSNVIKVYRGGILNLSYNDATGASSDIYDDFVFQVMSTPSFMTKANGSNSHFNCSSNISAGTYNAAFQLMVKNSTKLVAVSIQVLDPSGVNVTYPDSIKIESMAEKVAYKE